MFFLAYGIAVFAIVSTFLLAKEVFSVGVAVACAILFLVPNGMLFAMLGVHLKATSYLRQYGINAGLMGTDPRRI